MLLLAGCMLIPAALGVVLFPREHEVALMSFRDAEYGKALRFYQDRLDGGDTTVTVVMPLIQIYQEIGQTDRAVDVLERYVRRNPADLEALTLLVRLCKEAVLPGKYARYLAALHGASPSAETAAELANVYDFEQRYDAYIALLGQSKGTGHRSRLVRVLASLGRKVDAITVAQRPDAGDGQALDADAQYIVFRLLVDMRQTSEAIQLAGHWVESAPAASLPLASFAEWLLYKGYPNDALRLIEHKRTDFVTAAPDLRHVYESALRATGDFDRLRDFWRQRLAVAELGEDEETSILYGLLDIGDHERGLGLLRKRAEARRGNWIFAYVENAVKFHRERELASYLESEFARRDASTAELQQVASVVLQSSPATLVAFLTGRAEKDPQTWAIVYADALQRSGRSGELLLYIDRIIADGRLEKTARDQWLHRLIDQGGAERALPHLRRAAGEEGSAWRGVYLAVLRKLGRVQELRAYLAATAGDSRLSEDQRRLVAQEMLSEGMKQDALALLMQLADGSPPGSSKVRELMFFWGPRLDAKALAWLNRQLAAAPVADREGWLRLLLDASAADLVIAWFESQGDPGAVPGRLYVEALAATGQPQKAARAISSALPVERDPAVLRRYASIASDGGDLPLAERAWASLLAVVPDDEPALRGRGLILFSQRRFPEAETDLRRYLRVRQDDHEASYAYAEVMTNLKRLEEAKEHYRNALALIAALRDRPYSAQLTRAMCLQRLGRKEEAVAAFQQLLAAYPTQRGLRADFASVLLENNATEMANHVLGLR